MGAQRRQSGEVDRHCDGVKLIPAAPHARSCFSFSMHDTPRVLSLGAVDVGAVALGVDERIHGTLRCITREEFPVPAPLPCVGCDPYVSWETAEHPERPLEVSFVS